MRFRFLALAVLLATPGTPAANPPTGAGLPLVILSPHNEAIREEFERGFSRWHAARHGETVDIDWRIVGGSSESIRFVQSEFSRKPDGIGIDLFFGGGQEPYYELADKRLADPYRLPPPILDGLAKDVAGIELRAPDFAWYGAAISTFGILQNLRVQSLARLPAIERWADLARPDLQGWVGAGDPRGSGTMLVMFESFLQARGWDDGWSLLTRLAGNTRRFDRISSTTAKDAAVGETAYALAIDFYAFTQIAAAGRTNLSFLLPLDFAALNPDGIAILRGAPHRDLARRFLEYTLSDDGQKLWLLPKGHPEGPSRHSIERMPVRPALYAEYRDVSNIGPSPFHLPAGFRYDARLAQQRRGVVATLAGAILVDVHDDLQTAWKSVIRRGLPPGDVAELGRVPITEAQARELSGTPWRDPATRHARKTEWQIWARDKYRSIASSRP
ncbi:MAG: ABC transporter substrate-binding protein [Limisphaerales bacterium]